MADAVVVEVVAADFDLAFRKEYVHQIQAVAVHAAYSANSNPAPVQYLHSFARYCLAFPLLMMMDHSLHHCYHLHCCY